MYQQKSTKRGRERKRRENKRKKERKKERIEKKRKKKGKEKEIQRETKRNRKKRRREKIRKLCYFLKKKVSASFHVSLLVRKCVFCLPLPAKCRLQGVPLLALSIP